MKSFSVINGFVLLILLNTSFFCMGRLWIKLPKLVDLLESKAYLNKNRNSHRRCSVEKLIWKNLEYSQENARVGVSFLSKKRLQHRCFPVNIVKFLTPSLYKIYKQLLLEELIKREADSGISAKISFLINSVAIHKVDPFSKTDTFSFQWFFFIEITWLNSFSICRHYSCNIFLHTCS